MESRPNDNSGADAVNEADQQGAQHNAGVNIVLIGLNRFAVDAESTCRL